MQDTRMQCKSGQDAVGCGILADIPHIRAHMQNIRRNASIRECPKLVPNAGHGVNEYPKRFTRVGYSDRFAPWSTLTIVNLRSKGKLQLLVGVLTSTPTYYKKCLLQKYMVQAYKTQVQFRI